MSEALGLQDRIEGCLTGAAIGAELALARWVRPDWYVRKEAKDIPGISLRRIQGHKEEPHRGGRFCLRILVDLGVRAFLKNQGRVTPEDFAALLASDNAVAAPVFPLDTLHTIQEILREGMNPRISGLGAAPSGFLCAAMPAVGIYHLGDPQRAYLDGVEIASVAQPRVGADWAGLCAAAIAAAFENGATKETVLRTVLGIAHQHNKDVFYELNEPLVTIGWLGNEAQKANWWLNHGCRSEIDYRWNWPAHNPMRYLMPPLRLADTAERLFRLILAAEAGGYNEWCAGGLGVSTVVAGAVMGALHGGEAFSRDLRDWAVPLARSWFGLGKVVAKRLDRERSVIAVIERSSKVRRGQGSLLRDKIAGNLLAGAIGNAMGSPVEGRFYWEIDRDHPKGIRTVLQPERLESEDDNQMAMHLVETYLARSGQPVMARQLGQTWLERMNRDGFFALCMGNAYDLLRAGWDPRIAGHWSIVTGSTVMCMEPVGLYNIADPDYASIDALAISYMYQRGLDALAAANLAATVAEAMRLEATVDSVCQAALDNAPAGPLHTFDRRRFRSFRHYLEVCLDIADKYDDVLAARKELYDKCLMYHPIDPLELWGFALAMFKIARGDVRQAAIGGTNIGRDSDTIAGRAAMLAGTLRGAGNVPKEWIAMVPRRALDRIGTAADRFADLLTGGKLDTLLARQKVAEGEKSSARRGRRSRKP
jgi:ADP-ribosylglycohydrolase